MIFSRFIKLLLESLLYYKFSISLKFLILPNILHFFANSFILSFNVSFLLLFIPNIFNYITLELLLPIDQITLIFVVSLDYLTIIFKFIVVFKALFIVIHLISLLLIYSLNDFRFFYILFAIPRKVIALPLFFI